MLNYTEDAIDNYFEAIKGDPLSKEIAKYSGNSKGSQFIEQARKAGIADVAIKAGLIQVDKDAGHKVKKVKYSIEELLMQLKGFKKDSALETNITTKKQFNQIAKKIHNDIFIIDAAEVKELTTAVIKEKELKNKEWVHEFSPDEVKKLHNTFKKAWSYFNTAVEHGYKGKLRVGDMSELLSSFSTELVQINAQFEMPKLKEFLVVIDDLMKAKILFVEPEQPIATPKDLAKYFKFLEKDRKSGEKKIESFKKKKPAYKQKQGIKSEKQEVKELIKNAGITLSDAGTGDDISAVNKEVDKIFGAKLGTGRKAEEYFTKIAKDSEADVAAAIMKVAKSEGYKSKVGRPEK